MTINKKSIEAMPVKIKKGTNSLWNNNYFYINDIIKFIMVNMPINVFIESGKM